MPIQLSSNKIRFRAIPGFVLLLVLASLSVYGQKASRPTWRERGNNRGYTFYEVQQDFYRYWADKPVQEEEEEGKEEAGYEVFERWEDFMAPRVYPSGNMNLPSSNYENFIAWERRNNISDRSPSGAWTPVGPPSKASGYDAGVGRVDFVRFDPTNSNTMYLCTPDGGLWKTTNGNAALPTWTTNNDFLAVIGCSDLVINPTNPQVMYLATGSWEGDKRSAGILKSTNGGTTWTTTALAFDASNSYVIRKLIMDPSNPLVMLAATNGGLFRTTDGWASQVNILDGNYNVQDLKFKPGDPNTVYATGINSTTNNVYWKSTNNGATWAPVTSALPVAANVSRVLLAVTAGNAAYVYVLAGNATGGYLGTYRSADSGTTFTVRSSAPAIDNILNCTISTTVPDGQAAHDMAIAVSPGNPENVTIAGCNIWTSTNGGTSWTISSYWLGNDVNNPGGNPVADYVHADIQSLEYLPGSSTTLFATCDGGVSRSTNNGANWTDLSNNLQIAQETDVALSANDPTLMVAGLQDIGTLKSGTPWSVINGGDGESAFIDRTNNLTIVTSNPYGGHAISFDGGPTHDDITGLPPGTEFFSPIIQDPVSAITVYVGGRPALYRSTNLLSGGTYSWTTLGTPSGTGSIIRLVVAPSNNQVIYTLKQDAVSKSIDGGTTWTNVTSTLPVGAAQVTNLAISNTNPLKVWVTFSGYDAATKVFKTTDGGATWTDVFSAGLPNIPINTIVYRNGSAIDEVYIGADIGVFVIDNTLSAWVPFYTGLARSIVRDLEIYYPTGKLRTATYGRGTWESDLHTTSTGASVAIKVYLQGPYNVGAGTMNDDLRAGGYLPTADPYPGLGFTHVMGENETLSSGVMTILGNDAIVDRVFVELRSMSAPATVLYTRSALLQRDGDVVDRDGVSALYFANAPAGNYYVAVRHRNHLGFRTLGTVALSGTTTALNFTDNSVPTFGTEALKLLTAGVYGMYSGDANRDGNINAADRNGSWRPQNGGTYNYSTSTADFDLNGTINAVDKNTHWRPNNSRVQQLD